MLNFTIDDFAFEWNGAHTVNVWRIDPTYRDTFYDADVFSLNYGRDDYTPQEVLIFAYDWIQDQIAEEAMI